VAVLRPSAATGEERIEVSLRALGYEPGRDVTIDIRFAGGDVARLPALAAELVRQQPEVVIAVGEAAARAVRSASVTVPLVMFGNFDPVAAGLAQSLARPGRDTTGVMISSEGTLAGKKLELLREAVPGLQRIGVLIPEDSAASTQMEEIRRAAAALGVEVLFVEVRGGSYEPAFAEFTQGRAGAVLVAAHTFFVRDRRAIIDAARKARLPAIYEWPDQVRDGGLMSYGPPSLDAMWRRIAEYVDRILKGAQAGDLPIELPFRLELAINLQSASAIGFTVPPVLLARATEIID
jgi:putative ABC transport system substrate-binding protein